MAVLLTSPEVAQVAIVTRTRMVQVGLTHIHEGWLGLSLKAPWFPSTWLSRRRAWVSYWVIAGPKTLKVEAVGSLEI